MLRAHSALSTSDGAIPVASRLSKSMKKPSGATLSLFGVAQTRRYVLRRMRRHFGMLVRQAGLFGK